MRTLDLFAGIGLFSEGLHRAGFETVAACEICPRKRVLLREMVGPDVPIYEDVTALTGERILADVGPVELVAGSPPCTDISTANTQAQGVDGEESRLFFEAARLVRELRPRWVCLENSSALRIRGADRVLDALERAGYSCWPLVVGAEHAGAPHRRLRSWIVAANREGQRRGEGRQGRPDTGDPGQPEQPLPLRPGGDAARAADAQPAREQVGPSGQPWAEDAAHTDGRSQHGSAEHGEASGQSGGNAADAPCCPGHTQHGQREEVRDKLGVSDRYIADPHGTGLAFWQGLAGDHGPQLAALERELGPAIHQWAGGLGRYLQLVDGLPAPVARFVMSACGDAVVCEVVEAIGRGIMAAEREMVA